MSRRTDDPRPLTRVGSARVRVEEASGLAWDPSSRRLLAVGDEASRVYEIELGDSPKVVRRIELEGDAAHDLEGVALSPDGEEIWVTVERKRRILIYDRAGHSKRGGKVHVEGESDGDGLEGIAIDPEGRVFVVHEKNPVLLLELHPTTLEILSQTEVPGLADLSGVCTHAGALWIVSDQTRRVVRLVEDEDGNWSIAGTWSIETGNAEGIEIVDGLIYLAFDTNGDGSNLAWYELPDR